MTTLQKIQDARLESQLAGDQPIETRGRGKSGPRGFLGHRAETSEYQRRDHDHIQSRDEGNNQHFCSNIDMDMHRSVSDEQPPVVPPFSHLHSVSIAR